MAAEVGLAAAVVELLRTALDAVLLIKEARDDCKGAPALTQRLVQNIASTATTLEILKNVVSKYPDKDWNYLKDPLSQLGQLLKVASEEVSKHVQKNEQRKKASVCLERLQTTFKPNEERANSVKLMEIVKSFFKLGAAKQNKVTKATLEQINSCRKRLDSIVGAANFKAAFDHYEKEKAYERAHELLARLRKKAKLCEGDTRLDGIHLKRVGEIGKLIDLEPYQFISPQQEEESNSNDSSDRLRGRESGMRVPNSAEIKFQITGVNSGWYFYVVIADLRKQTPKLFFPENLTTADHLLGNKIRLFPDKSVAYKHDPRGLKLERSEEAPPDGDSPWSIYIVITSKRVLPKGDISKTLLTIEDIAEVLDEDGTKVKEFLIDVMMQADGAPDRSLYNSTFGAVAAGSRSTDRSLDNPSFGAVAADSRSSEQASRSSSSTSFLQMPTHHMLFVIILLAAILYQQLLYWSGSR